MWNDCESYSTSRRTCVKRSKAEPTIRATPSNNANWGYSKGRSRKAIVVGLENCLRVRSIHSSQRRIMTVTGRRNAVYATSKGKMEGRKTSNEANI
ncbi:MAG: hypothetical protein IJ587_05860 [Synergistaceae bacterium]|nr:hypothetical protein [Synergistaceae bacterium]